TDANGAFRFGQVQPGAYVAVGWAEIDSGLALYRGLVTGFESRGKNIQVAEEEKVNVSLEAVPSDTGEAEGALWNLPLSARYSSNGPPPERDLGVIARRPLGGRVLDQEGQPILKARVRIAAKGEFYGPAVAMTDDKGEFTFPEAPRSDFTLSAEKAG